MGQAAFLQKTPPWLPTVPGMNSRLFCVHEGPFQMQLPSHHRAVWSATLVSVEGRLCSAVAGIWLPTRMPGPQPQRSHFAQAPHSGSHSRHEESLAWRLHAQYKCEVSLSPSSSLPEHTSSSETHLLSRASIHGPSLGPGWASGCFSQ